MTSTLRARSTISVVALLLSGLLAGCDEADPAEPLESTAAATSPSPSLSTEPTTPTDSGSPVATVRTWIAAYNSAFVSGDTSAASALTGRGCSTCDELLASIEEVHHDGGYFRGGRWTIDAARVTDRLPDSAVVTAGITVAAGTTKSSRDAQPEWYPQERFALEFEISRDTDPAIVEKIVFLS